MTPYGASKKGMGVKALLLTIALLATPAAGQEAPAPRTNPSQSSSTPAPELPVSLDRIRQGLQRPDRSVLEGLDRQADFRIEIQEKQKLDEILKRLDFKSGPVPAGGLYMYEQQRRLFSPTERPLQQPYAAFSGGELITIAIQNLIAHYVGKPLVESLSNANRARQARNARDEVQQEIAAYCATRPDRWEMELCNPTIR